MPSVRELFGALEQVIEGFLKHHQEISAEVLRYRWDAPDRMIVFPSRRGHGLWNNIHLLYVPEQHYVRVTAAAWKDAQGEGSAGTRVRSWGPAEQGKAWRIDVTPGGLVDAKAASAALVAAYDAVSSVDESELSNQDEIP